MIVTEIAENLRSLELGEYKVSLERRDPHGFWYFKWPSGPVPDRLTDAYTGTSYAYEALKNWYDNLPKIKPVKKAA